MFRLRLWSSVVAMTMVAVPAMAQESTRLEPVVVTATKLETPQERLGASVTVITGEEIEARHYETVGDVLRQVPGVEIQRQGSRGKLTSLRIRGAGTTQVQVLVDGLRVKSPTTGTFDFSDLAIDQIERIEIVRGPQATLHGADAIGGVVNIITKRGEGPPTGTFTTQGGNFDTHREQFSFSGAYKLLDYTVSASVFGSGGQFDNDDSEQQALALRLGLSLPRTGHLSLSTRYAKSSTDLPVDRAISTDPFFILDPDSQQENELTTLSILWEQKPVGWYELNLRLGQFWNRLRFEDPFTPGVDFGSTVSRVDTRRREIELVNHFHAGKWNTLSVGLEHRTEWAENLSVFTEEVDIRSAFFQDELRFFDRLFLSGGVRVEDHETFGTETTPRVGAVYLIKELGTKLRGTWGEGFRAPTLNDLFFPDLTGGLCPPFGNVNLQPERSESWEAGADQKLWEQRMRLGVTYFKNTFRNLITVVSLPPFCAQAGNVGKARTEGVELYNEFEPFDWLLFNVNYTLTDTQDQSTGKALPRFARHRWNAGVTVTPVRRLSFFAQSYVVSRQFDNIVNRDNPGYHRIDVGGTYHLVERRGAFPALDLITRVQNLTDEDYSEVFGFEALGINALAGLQARY